MTPAYIVQQLLVDAGTAILPGLREIPDEDVVEVHANNAPDNINRCVLVRDTAGVQFGHDQREADVLEHAGLLITVRHDDDRKAGNICKAVAGTFKARKNVDVEVDDLIYHVQSVYRTSSLLSLGEEVGKRRFLWSFNARVAMQAREPTPVE